MIHLATTEISELTDYTASNQASSMPASYLANIQPQYNLQFTDSSDMSVTGYMGDAFVATGLTGIQLIVAGYHTFTAAATWELFFGPSEASVQSSGTAAAYVPPHPLWRSNDLRHHARRLDWYLHPSLIEEPWFRVVFADVANPNGYGLGLLLPYPAVSIAAQAPVFAGVEEEVRAVVAGGGARFSLPSPKFRTREIRLQAHGPEGAAALDRDVTPLLEQVGSSGPLLVITEPDASAYAMNRVIYGTVAGTVTVPLQHPWNISEVAIQIKEML